MPMTNDSLPQKNVDSDHRGKHPKSQTINFIKQYARVYSTYPGVMFSYCILN